MSSRILRGDEAVAASSIRWRRSGYAAASDAPLPDSLDGCHDADSLAERFKQFEREAHDRVNKARQAGFEEGQADAVARLTEPLNRAVARLAAGIEEMAAFRRKLRREAEEDLVRLAVAIARRVLRRELAADPEAILGVAKAALSKLDSREILRVRAHPAEADAIRQLLAERQSPERIEVVPDRTLERGAFLVDTNRGYLDASVETQLAEIERGLADLLHRPL